LHRLVEGCILALVFFAGWWWRPLPLEVKLSLPYFAGFFVAILALLATLAWLAAGLPGLAQAMRDGRRVFLICLFALTSWVVISPAWARYDNEAMAVALQFAVVALVATISVCAGPAPRQLALALAAGLLVQAAVVLVQFSLQRPVGLHAFGEFDVRPGDVGLSVVVAGPLRLMRPYGLTSHPNVAGGVLAAALVALGGWLGAKNLPTWRWAARALILVIGFWALLATFSRGAWAAFAVGLAALAFAAWRRRVDRMWWRGAVLALGLLLIVAALFVAAYPDLVLTRVGGEIENTELISIGTRQIFYDFAIQIIRRAPIIGTGIGTFPWEARDLLVRTSLRTLVQAENVHSVPILILSEIGIVGLVLWLVVVVAALARAWRRALTPDAAGLAAAAAALLAAGVLDHYPWSMFPVSLLTWILLAAAARGS
jgi:O-antigen ligase